MFTARSMPTNRMVIYDLLQRTRRYHCPIGAVYEWDFTDTLARLDALEAAGSPIGLAAMITKATATVMAKADITTAKATATNHKNNSLSAWEPA